MRTPVTIAIVLLVTFVMGVTPATAGTLKVTSFPSGAEVIVDGVNTGKVTPMNISLADGDHIVTVRIPGSGWNPDTRTVTIVPGNNDLSVTLLPMPTPGPPGPKGDKGDPGPQGPKGDTVAADGPCFDKIDNFIRYVNCLNGTVTDTVTGLIWLRDANCLGSANWAAASVMAAALKDGECGLTDGSSPGDWRLPTKDEWSATIAHAARIFCVRHATGGPSLTNDLGEDCYAAVVGAPLPVGSSFANVPSDIFWSSTTWEGDRGSAWAAYLDLGFVQLGPGKPISARVWPVRGGHR